MFRTYRQLPQIQTGYPLDDVWSIVVPVARTNLIQNPSFETNTTSWTASGGSIARSTAQQYHGAYSLAITPTATTTDGVRYDTVSLTSGTTYAYSAKIRGVAGLKYSLSIDTTGGVALNTVTFTATGRWQWIYGYYTETSTTTRRVYARKAGHASVAIFYLDGVQVEAIVAGETVSTYIDGDQQGLTPNQLPIAFYWNGTPHASSSTRSGLTRAGGMVVSFKKYGFLLTAIIGLGLAAPLNVATDYARIDGGYDDYTRKPSRQFTLTGRFQGRTYAELRRNRSALSQLFDRDLTGQDQRLTLLRHVEDGYGRVTSTTVRSLSKYESGLGGNTDNMHAETVPLTFTQYLPNILADGEDGEALSVQLSVSNANAIVQRSPAGVWSALSTGMSGGSSTTVFAIVRSLSGAVYAGGEFTGAGASGADYIAQWDGSAWSVVGSATAINAVVRSLAIGPDGALYVGGAFTNAGGVAAADGIAKWDGSTWTALGTGASVGAAVYALAFGPDGTLYAGGDFTSMGGVANTAGIAKWNGSAWSAMGTGVGGNSVFALAVFGTTVYAGGDFINMGGVAAADGIAKWNGSTWSALSTGTTQVNGLAVGLNGTLYVGGPFTSIGGVTTSFFASWNGTQFQALGTIGGDVRTVVADTQGVIHIGGVFPTINGVTYPDFAARYINGSFSPEDIDLPGAVVLYAVLPLPDGTLYLGFQGTGTATAAGTTTLTNTGTARTYPTVTIKGPSSGTSRIYSIINATTGRAIYLNLTINAGETCRLVLQPDNLSFTSDFQGNIASSILGGSNEADFFLQPGANSIAFLSSVSTVTATVNWRPAYASLDDVP